MTKQKFHFIGLGCPKNQVDSEVMAALLEKGGYEMTTAPEEAHLILINTCAFIRPAKQEAIDEILRMAEWKKTWGLPQIDRNGMSAATLRTPPRKRIT